MALVSELDRKTRPRTGPQVLIGLVLGAALGAGASLLMPHNYVAETSLLLPSINASVLKKVTQTLSEDASGVQWNNASTSDSQMVEAARLVLKSRAALTITLRESKVSLPPKLFFFGSDPLEAFRQNNIQVQKAGGNALNLSVAYPQAEGARSLCQGLLNYYTNFVHDHRLTNTARTRQQLEEKLIRVDRRLSVLERKLLAATDGRWRIIGDSTIRPDPKVMKDLWRQRILESGSSKRLLDEMRKIRKDSAREQKQPADEEIGNNWRSRWGSTSLEEPGDREESLPNNARRSDIPSRLELERVYEETLLLYHAGLVQHDFLSMWESLENFDFEVIDPVSVRKQSYLPGALYGSLLGGVLGAALMGFLRRAQS